MVRECLGCALDFEIPRLCFDESVGRAVRTVVSAVMMRMVGMCIVVCVVGECCGG